MIRQRLRAQWDTQAGCTQHTRDRPRLQSTDAPLSGYSGQPANCERQLNRPGNPFR